MQLSAGQACGWLATEGLSSLRIIVFFFLLNFCNHLHYIVNVVCLEVHGPVRRLLYVCKLLFKRLKASVQETY